MYITITKQQTKGNYAQSVADFVAYLDKENENKAMDDMEHFFNQYTDEISNEEVINEIDGNTSKLKKTEPKFYSITVNPSARELKKLKNDPEKLKHYTRELMKDYAASFNREINGRKVSVDDIKYYAKIEHTRSFKGTDRQIRENQPFATKILELKNQIRSIQQGKAQGNINILQHNISRLEKEAPHQLNGKRIVQGMAKPGPQSHVHIIVSRKDMSNSFSLSPGSKYKASETILHGKTVKRGFDRNRFFACSEKTFDKLFHYNRNFVETYKARKTFLSNPKRYFSIISGLPTEQKKVAFNLLRKTGIHYPNMNIPTNKVQLALKIIHKLRKGVNRAIESGSIGI